MERTINNIFYILIISILFFSASSRAQDVKQGKVINVDREKRVIAVDLGIDSDIKPGAAFIIYSGDNTEIGCILAEKVTNKMFWSDLVPIGIFNDIEIGYTAQELGAGCRIIGTMITYIPQGYFGMGDNKQEDEMPVHSVRLNAFYIDKYEVTNKEYKRFIDAENHPAPFSDSKEAEPFNWTDGNYPEGKEHHPVVLVNANDAKKYCEFVNKRLPTEQEWEKVARGTGSRIWPWGNVWDPKKLNCKESGGTGPMIIGTFPDDLSPYDVNDMGGNVSEWTSSPYLPYENNHMKNNGYSEDLTVIRGGSFKSDKNEARTSKRQYAPPDTKSISIGFRCVKEL